MEKKYYFRGLGLGIIVTALIMGIVLSRGSGSEMTDDEVIARAIELGMTENTTLVEPTETEENPEETGPPETEESPAETEPAETGSAETEETPEETEAPAETEPVKLDVAVAQPADRAEGEAQEMPEETASPVQSTQDQKPASETNEMMKPDEDTEQTASPGAESTQQTAAMASVTIVSGDGSYTVAKKLEEAGVIFSASSYDDYLCQNGYDKRLRTGTFQIPPGASDEQIAKIVTGQS